MCGDHLEVKDGDKIAKCPSCDTVQTIPSTNDEASLKLINRGNTLRSQGEFDKAYGIFSQLLNNENEDAEIYWNLLLCKYGITYVDDYDGKKKPTINRMSRVSILDDEDYKKVISLADVVSKENYEYEAKRISDIQKNILKIADKEEPYDIFISYKESDEAGDRTRDSVLAQEIYETLIKEGYRVFLSRITLSEVIGKEYEPYIYSALYTSKIMLLIATDETYVNSVWVKNEWTRFLNMMKEDKSKVLIPCYRDLDPYDLPKEIRNFQGLDMSKLGFIQDLKVGVNKILGKTNKKNVSSNKNKEGDSPNDLASKMIKRGFTFLEQEKEGDSPNDLASKMIKRGFIFLEQEKRGQAEKMFEESLLYEPRTYAYLGLLCLNYYCSTIEELYALDDNNIAKQPLFIKAEKVANETEKQILDNIVKSIAEKRNKKDTAKYNHAIELKNNKKYNEAIEEFKKLGTFSDSKKQIEECKNLILEDEKAALYKTLNNHYKNHNYNGVLTTFAKLYNLDKNYKDSNQIQEESLEKLCNKYLEQEDYVTVRDLLNKNVCFSEEFKNKMFEKCAELETKHFKNEEELKRKKKILEENSSWPSYKPKLRDLKQKYANLSSLGDFEYAPKKAKEIRQIIRKKKAQRGLVIAAIMLVVCGIGARYLAYFILGQIDAKRLSSIEARQQDEFSLMQDKYGAPVFDFNNLTVTYGMWAQTVVDDTSLIAELDKLTDEDKHSQADGRYYHNEEYYVKRTAKPYKSSYVFNNGSKIESKTYWFKCEPVKWKIIDAEDNAMTLIPATLLTTCYFASSATSYNNSKIREWINSVFYNACFALDDSLILTTEVDNSSSTLDTCGSSYASENTNDKLYLLSYQDIYQQRYQLSIDPTDPYNSMCQTSDWSRVIGTYCDASNNYTGDYWTRSRCSGKGYPACVNSNNTINHSVNTDYAAFIRPCMRISHTWTEEEKNLVNKRFVELEEGKNIIKEKYSKPVLDLANNTIKYGIYPQTVVSDETLIEKLNTSSVYDKATGYSYYNGEYYKRFAANPNEDTYTFDNGETIVSGKKYWFKLEPVEWKIMKTDEEGQYQLITSKLIMVRYWVGSTMDSSYENSALRPYLNSTFFNEVFIDQSYVQETSSGNKFYILSNDELSSSEYGFSSDNSSRYCKTTDYATANNACIYTEDELKGNGMYWTRTHIVNCSDVYYVTNTGFNYRKGASTIICVRPCVNIKIS